MYNIQADNPDHSDYLQSCLEFTICTKNDPRRQFPQKIRQEDKCRICIVYLVLFSQRFLVLTILKYRI